MGADRQVTATGAVPAGPATVRATFRSGGAVIECRSGCRVRIRDITGVMASHPITFQRYAK
jgi:hypothetical protein